MQKSYEVKEAKFVVSNSDYKKCPNTPLPEYAFIGRSNVGKSSLINMLTNRKSLAKTSGKPGKTQLINHFMVNNKWYLVDLPGYGWAQVSKAQKAQWGDMIADYLLERQNLTCLLVLIDIRLDPQPIDVDFIEWLGEEGIPFVLVFTKADKLSKNKNAQNVAKYKKVLLRQWESLPATFITSATNKQGRDEVLRFIHETNKALEANKK